MTGGAVEMSIELAYPEEGTSAGITGPWFCIRGKDLYSVTEDSWKEFLDTLRER